MYQKFKVCWNITNLCNDKCSFCYRDKVSARVSATQGERLVCRLAASGVQSLTFSGGEALLVPELPDLVAIAKSLGLETTVVTNAILFNEDVYCQLKANIDWLTFSLDSLDQDTQRKMGRNKNHVSNILSAIDIIRRLPAPPRIKLNTVLSRMNLGQMQDLFEFVNSQALVKRWKVLRFTSLRGDAIQNSVLHSIDDQAFALCQSALCTASKRSDLRIDFEDCASIRQLYIVISPDGRLARWTREGSEITLGNVLWDDIDLMMAKSDMSPGDYDARISGGFLDK